MNIHILFVLILKFIVDIIVFFRRLFFRIFISKFFKKIYLRVYKNKSIMLYPFGDITEILYSKYFLVSHQKGFEFNVLDIFFKNLKDNSVFFDIGANVGVYSILASKQNHNIQIFAFEPAKTTSLYLEKNIKLNSINNVNVIKSALSDYIGIGINEKPLYIDKAYKFGDAFNYIKKTESYTKDSFPIDTIDNYVNCNNILSLDLLKIDIEGGELPCLRGGINSLIKFRPVIIFESSEECSARFFYNKIDLLVFLHQLGYTIKEIEENQYIAFFAK
jgi:FkbM family methyltransferase